MHPALRLFVIAVAAFTMFAAALVMLTSAPANAVTVKSPIRVVDGDTVQINRTVYRLEGFDAPGIRFKSCRGPGLAAKARLAELLAPPAKVTFYTRGKDNYGRTKARFIVKGHDRATHRSKDTRVDKIMAREGHTVSTRTCE